MMLKGNCIEVMKAMKPNSMEAIVTDPPYGLEFMGKEWDSLGAKFRKQSENDIKRGNEEKHICGRFRLTMPDGYKAGKSMQLWHTQWLTEAYRVLKPGGSMLVMGGTRTSHRLACAIEDTGFIIKDTLMWLYGSGFPKAQDLGKMIDKRMGKGRESLGKNPNCRPGSAGKQSQSMAGEWTVTDITAPSTDLAKHWDGFKVGGIKPAYEPIIWAVKPPEGSYVDNVLKWGVGGVNVDECRVGLNNNDHKGKGGGGVHEHWVGKDMENRIYGKIKRTDVDHAKGRFPANVILSHHPECVQVGVKRVKSDKGGEGRYPAGIFGIKQTGKHYADLDGYEQVESWDCHTDCPIRLLDEQSGVLKSGKPAGIKAGGKLNCYGVFAGGIPVTGIGDSGGASRFFYCAKASRGERNAGLEGMEENQVNDGRNKLPDNAFQRGKTYRTNTHPTVKPIKLFEYLIKLVTREGQIVLDPFIGSGTTAIAAHNIGRKCIGIEKEDEYLEIAKRRISYWQNQPKQNSLNLGE